MAMNGFLAFRWTLTTGRRSPGEVSAWSAPFPILPFLFATWGIGRGRKLVVIPRFQPTETIGALCGSAPATIQLPFPWRPRFLMTMARQYFSDTRAQCLAIYALRGAIRKGDQRSFGLVHPRSGAMAAPAGASSGYSNKPCST